MESLWNGEEINLVYRMLAGLLAFASIATIPSAFILTSVDNDYFNITFGVFCYAYIITLFISVAVRGKAPTGLTPWK